MPFTNAPHTICGTADPFPINNLSDLFPGSNPWLCYTSRGAWSLGLIILWCIAVTGIIRFIRLQRRQTLSPHAQVAVDRQSQIRQYARLMLLSSGALWFLLFALSSAAANSPRASCRYLICILLALPSILWPLWQGIGRLSQHKLAMQKGTWLLPLVSLLLLTSLAATYVRGTLQIFEDMHSTQSAYQQHITLIQGLLQLGATRIYSDYGTCNVLIFQSNERIICSVLDDHLQPGLDRYLPYRTLVNAAPHPAYVFIATSAADQAIAARRALPNFSYHHSMIAGYSVYY